jgi:hypothetical protein
MGDIYQEKGFGSRDAYLKNLAEEYEVSLSTVYTLAYMLGPNEDFDGLLTELEDVAELGYE